MAKKEYKKVFLKGSARKYYWDGATEPTIYLSVNVEQLAAIQNQNGYADIELRTRDDDDEFGNAFRMLVYKEPPTNESRESGRRPKPQSQPAERGGNKPKPRPSKYEEDDDIDELPF